MNIFKNIKKYYMHLICLGIIISFCFVYNIIIDNYRLAADRFEICYLDQLQKNNLKSIYIDTLNNKIKFLEKRVLLFNVHNKTINDIQQTLNLAFNSNRYESKYYSYFYNDMQELYSISWELLATINYIDKDFLLPYEIAIKQCSTLNIKYTEYISSSMLRLVVNTNYLIGCILLNNRDIEKGIILYKKSLESNIDSILIIDYYNKIMREYEKTEAIYDGIRMRSSGLYIPLYPYDFNRKKGKINKKEGVWNISNY